MRTLNIKEILSFIRTNSKMHDAYSNNRLRNKIYRSFDKNNIYYCLNGGKIDGFIEWFRYRDADRLIKDFNNNTIKDTSGKFLYISDYIFKDGILHKSIIDKFMDFQNRMGQVQKAYIMKYKQDKFFIKRFPMGRI